MQDYNYIYAGCYELTLEISCCKYPNTSELEGFWNENKAPLMNFLEQVHIGMFMYMDFKILIPCLFS